MSIDDQLKQACQLLCRVHFFGERLLFDKRLLKESIQMHLDGVIEEAKTNGLSLPLDPEIVEDVLSESAPVSYGGELNPKNPSLRPFMLRHFCSIRLCTSVNFADYVDCFEHDGSLAAEIINFIASKIKWAKERLEAQVGWLVDVAEDEKQFTYEECQKTDFRKDSELFEDDGALAAEKLDRMAEELCGIVEALRVREGKSTCGGGKRGRLKEGKEGKGDVGGDRAMRKRGLRKRESISL